MVPRPQTNEENQVETLKNEYNQVQVTEINVQSEMFGNRDAVVMMENYSGVFSYCLKHLIYV